MVRILKFFILLFFVAGLYSCTNKQNEEIPVSDFFKMPERGAFKISPDGRYISYLKGGSHKKQNLFIQSIADGREVQATFFTDYAVRGDYNWTYDNQIVFSQANDNEHSLQVIDLATLKTKTLLSAGKAGIQILNRNKMMPDIVTVKMNQRDSANFDIYRLNVITGELKPYLINPGNITEWLVDADGKIRLIKATDGIDETILYRPTEKAPFKAIIKNNFRNVVNPIAFNGTNESFYALSNVGRDKTAFVEISAKDGKELRVILTNQNADIQRVDYSKTKRRLELAGWEEAKPQKHFFDTNIKSIYQTLYDKFSGYEVNITDRDSSENKFIVQTYTDRSRGGVYLYERNSNKITPLADYTNINPELLCAKKPISYTTGDGLVINGYLTLPLGDKKTDLPVIVIPHDGPFGQRDRWNYSSEVQFFANRGFAVLQVNYRGSSGYGKYFYSAGFKEVGGKIQQDIADGVNWLIAQKIANPKKVAIYGRGFGGFSALYGVSFNPKLYNCAIVQNGLINFFTYVKTAPAFYKPMLQKMYATIGDPESDAGLLRNISPVFHSDKPKAAIFFLQEAKDPRANISELNHYIRELQKRNVPVKYSLNKTERGSVGGENKRFQNYADIQNFLDSSLQVKP